MLFLPVYGDFAGRPIRIEKAAVSHRIRAVSAEKLHASRDREYCLVWCITGDCSGNVGGEWQLGQQVDRMHKSEGQ